MIEDMKTEGQANEEVKQKSMKEELLNTIVKLREAGTNFDETPPLFRWTYPEEPEIMLQLMISGLPKEKEEPLIITPA